MAEAGLFARQDAELRATLDREATPKGRGAGMRRDNPTLSAKNHRALLGPLFLG